MPYQFLGDSARTYPQYLNADGSGTLHADPGGAYDMTPAAGIHELPVPPGDGLWGPWEAPGGPESTPPAPAALAPPVVPPSAPPEPPPAPDIQPEPTGPDQDTPPPDGTEQSGAAEAVTEEEGA